MEAASPGQLKRRRVVWVEHLGPAALAVLGLEALFLKAEIRFDPRDASPRALGFLALLRRAGLGGAFRERTLTCARRDAAGEALYYRREDELQSGLGGFADSALADRSPGERRALACFLANWLAERETFLVMAEEEARAEPAAEHSFLIVRQPAGFLLERPGRRLRQDWSPRGAIRALAAPLAVWTRALAASILKPSVKQGGLHGRDSVWVEYHPGDVGSYVSRAFWKDAVDPARFDRVYYGDDPGAPIAADAAMIEAYGFGWLDGRRPWEIAPPTLGTLAGVLREALASARRPWWLRMFEFELALWTAIWEAAFKLHRVRALYQYQDFSWRQEAQARALTLAGGTMIGLHWAEAPFLTEPEHLTPFDVYFAWGVNQSRRLAGKGHDCREILPSGAWILPDDKAIADLRAALGTKTFAVALFDTSYSDRIFVSGRMLSEFMLGVLTMIASKPGWKVVLKPKGSASYADLPDGGRIEEMIERLRAEGRAILVDWRVSPVSVGLACDISAGIGLNSAALLAGAFGGRCVHWDCAGWKRHPLVRDGRGTVVFDSVAETAAAVAAAPGNPRIGDFTRWARLVNHFGDRNAPGRIGGWMADYVEAVGGGASADDARRAAGDAYRRRHGVSGDFAERGEWWAPGA